MSKPKPVSIRAKAALYARDHVQSGNGWVFADPMTPAHMRLRIAKAYRDGYIQSQRDHKRAAAVADEAIQQASRNGKA